MPPILGSTHPSLVPFSSIPAVTYAVGDIHGRADLLKELLFMILTHRKQIHGSAKIVFLGDYVDRGPDEARVIDILRSKKLRKDFDEVVILKGNHELMLIDELTSYMADKTKISEGKFSVAKLYTRDYDAFTISLRTLRDFLEKMPLFHSDGIRLFTHAGVGPTSEIGSWSADDLLWYCGPVQDLTGRLVVHGHTIVWDGPVANRSAVNVDTGAFMSGRLTVAIFEGSSRQPTFLSTMPTDSPTTL
ncbi:serine/threonine protein phosphatase 1 [Verrucomicrobium sp. GAS474]|nr:serine/threonine protein phosphatase 1 [Verrucomicrobium sp. GAS474]